MGGSLAQGDPGSLVTGVSTDTRRLEPGALFLALSGDRFDGHAFLDEAVRRGAMGVVLERDRLAARPSSGAVVVVADCREALGRMAAAWRGAFELPVIAVAGSNGKTTTKELLASVLGERWPTLRSPASFNNDVGVPLTLLGLNASHGAAVVEVGTNHPGELAPLVRLARPRYGVLTSLGREHLEFFGSVEGVAEEEGWLAELLPADGRLFVDAESVMADRVVRRSPAPVVRVGTGADCDWQLGRVEASASGVHFEVKAPVPDWSGAYGVPLLGRHQARNATLALAVAATLGVSVDAARRGLARCRPAGRRLESWESGGVRVVDDAYNANVDSVLAALQVLRDLPCAGRRVAVLGDMAESGVTGPALHAEVGRHAVGLGVDQLVAVGGMARVTAEAARRAGLAMVWEFDGPEAATAALARSLRPGDVVLVKASRAARLELVSEGLRARLAAG